MFSSSTLKTAAKFKGHTECAGMTWSGDDQFLITVGEEGNSHVWDLVSRKSILDNFTDHFKFSSAAATSSSGLICLAGLLRNYLSEGGDMQLQFTDVPLPCSVFSGFNQYVPNTTTQQRKLEDITSNQDPSAGSKYKRVDMPTLSPVESPDISPYNSPTHSARALKPIGEGGGFG